MNLINEFKFSFRKLLIPFYQSEIKEAYVALNEIERNLKMDINAYCIWPELANSIEKKIILNPKWFILTINKNNLAPRAAVYFWCFNKANDELLCTDMIQLSKRDGLQKALKFLSTEISKIKNEAIS